MDGGFQSLTPWTPHLQTESGQLPVGSVMTQTGSTMLDANCGNHAQEFKRILMTWFVSLLQLRLLTIRVHIWTGSGPLVPPGITQCDCSFPKMTWQVMIHPTLPLIGLPWCSNPNTTPPHSSCLTLTRTYPIQTNKGIRVRVWQVKTFPTWERKIVYPTVPFFATFLSVITKM